MTIQYQCLDHSIQENALDDFVRHQETHQVLRYKEGKLLKEDAVFIDEWNLEALRQRVKQLNHLMQAGGKVVVARHQNKIIGFASISSDVFGDFADYVELTMCHVSKPFRGHGIGKRLFQLCAKEALNCGATKLYIGAHPSYESQAFYQKMGTELAQEINAEIAQREPFDIQLEYDLIQDEQARFRCLGACD